MIADRYIVGLGVSMRTDRGSRIGRAGSCFQILAAGRSVFRVREPSEPRGALGTRAIIPPGAEYVIEADDVEMLTAFVEADGILGRRARYEMDAAARRGSSAWIEMGERLIPDDLWRYAHAGDWPMAFHRLAGALDRKRRGLAHAGPRVRRAAALVESSLPERITMAALSQALEVTPEQLTRLLLDDVGLAWRPFVYWLRLQRYASLVSAGATVDAAARAVGYRRRAELMQEWRRLFGKRDLAAGERFAPLSIPPSVEIRTA